MGDEAVSHPRDDLKMLSNTARSRNVGFANIKTGTKIIEKTRREPLSEDVREL